VFHNAKKNFQSEKSRNFLNKLGIYWENYHNVPVKVWCNSYKDLNIRLGKEVLNNNIVKNQFYSALINWFQFDHLGEKKLNASLINSICNGWLNEGTSSFSLIDYNYPRTRYNIYYMPKTLEHYLLSIEYDRNIKPIKFHFITKGIFKTVTLIAKIVIKSFSKVIESLNKNYQKTNKNYQKNNFEIAFVPHRGFKYGEFYKKTYLFEKNPDSLLYKKKLLIIAFNDLDKLSERYCRIFKIPYSNINVSLFSIGLDIVRFILESIRNIKLLKFNKYNLMVKNIATAIIILRQFVQISIYLKFLKKYRTLKLIYFHYDILVNSPFLLACHLKNIKTISSQNRPISAVWGKQLIYDHYFIAGNKFKELYKQRKHVIGKYHVIGLPRSSLIKISNFDNKYEKYIRVKNKYSLAVCYDVLPLSFFQEGLESETYSEKCIEDFYLSIIALSREFSNIFFVIKPKSLDIFNRSFFQQIHAKINSIENIEIISDLKKYNPYVMASLSDIIIGKHTTILEEAFAAGKKVIFYDSEKYLENSGYIFNEINLVVKNYEGLKKRFHEIIVDDNYLLQDEWEKFKNNYFSSPSKLDGFNLIREEIKSIYDTIPTA